MAGEGESPGQTATLLTGAAEDGDHGGRDIGRGGDGSFAHDPSLPAGPDIPGLGQGLAPLLFLLLPTAYLVAAKGQRSLPCVGTIVGAGFALATGVGPAVHNVLVGPHGPLGRWATETFGADPMVAAHNLRAMSHSAVVEGLLQIVVGLVVYVVLSWLSLAIVAGVLALRTNRWHLWSEPEWALLRGGRPEHLAVQG